jgi:hypothetical protein
LQAHVSDRRIVAAGEPADVVGINCPLGWPDDFVDFVNELRRGSVAQRADKPPDWRAISPTARRIDS